MRGAPEVRSATDGDYPAVIALLEAAGLPTAGVPRTLGDFLVADAGDGLAGAIGLERYGSGALLRSAVVRPGDQGTGIGAALVRAALDRARDGGLREIYLLTTTAERWFPRFGFAPIEREQVPDALRASVEFREACPASAAVMRMRISS
jgi:N-acetylglutamate synthase-like GNAT family acetyltransferase